MNLDTCVSTTNPNACEWCHTYHSDHQLCTMELLWTITSVNSVPIYVKLARLLPILREVQEIIVGFLVRSLRVYSTRQLGDNLCVPDFRPLITSSQVIKASGKFAQVFAKIAVWVAKYKHEVTTDTWASEDLEPIVIQLQGRPTYDVQVFYLANREKLCIQVDGGANIFDEIGMDLYLQTDGLAIYHHRVELIICHVCGEVLNFAMECSSCAEKRAAKKL